MLVHPTLIFIRLGDYKRTTILITFLIYERTAARTSVRASVLVALRYLYNYDISLLRYRSSNKQNCPNYDLGAPVFGVALEST